MRGRGTRAGMTVGVFLALGVLMTGCAWWGGAPKESLHERAARIQPGEWQPAVAFVLTGKIAN